MARRRFGNLRCFVLAIAALVISVCAFGVSVFAGSDSAGAEEISRPEIISKNISYSSELHTCYAVPTDSVKAGERVWLEIMNERGEVISTITEYRTENVCGITSYTFKGNGTSPRNIGRVEYVRAVTSDGGVSPTVEYSVLEYLCEKLCKEGYLNYGEDAGKEYTRRALYLQLLRYATSAQNLLGSQGVDLDEICYVGGSGGTGLGFKTAGEAVTLKYDQECLPMWREFISWNVAYYDLKGNLLDSFCASDGDTVNAAAFVCATPKYESNVPEGVIAIYDDTAVTISLMGGDGYRDAELECAEAIKAKIQQVTKNSRIAIAYGLLDPSADVNIIIGESENGASAKAYGKLAEVRSPRMYSEAGYVISVSGGDIAIAYDKNEYTSLQSVSFAAAQVINSLSEDRGVLYTEEFTRNFQTDLIEIQKALDVDFEEAQWAKLLELASKKYGAEQGRAITDAFREYYSMRDDNLIVWYANLYDPGVGGFYASNSGKTYEGYLPLLETTGQLLGHLSSMDVFSVKGDATRLALPELIKAQIVYFAKSCQDPNGYFYNITLGKEASDATVVRRGRDLSRVTSLLSTLGSRPTYDTPTGTRGDGITADQYWASTGFSEELKPFVPSSYAEYEEYLNGLSTSLASSDAARAVSALLSDGAVLCSSGDSTEASEAYLKSHAAFDAYLKSKDIDGAPYSVGNELNGTYTLIAVASKKLGAYSSADGESAPWYEGMTLCDMLIYWMSEHINEKGLFGTIPEGSTDPLDGIRYANANGFFKMITIYNAWKVEYPEPALAAAGLITGIKGDEPSTGNVCNVYNSWNALSSLMSNIRGGYGDMSAEERAKILSDINEIFAADAPAAIRNSYNKQKNYMCSDGTFSNSVSGSAASYPGGLGCGLGIKEGNVDAIGFGLYATTNSALSVLGLSEARVDYFHEGDYLVFLEEILNVKPVTSKIKFSVNDKSFVQDFEDYDPQFNLKITTLSKGGAGNTVEIVSVEGNKVVRVDKIYGTTASLVHQFYTSVEQGADKMIFGGRFKMVELSRNAQIQFSIVSSAKSPFLMLIQTKSTNLGTNIFVNGYDSGFIADGWFDFRIEYYVSARDENGAPTEFYAAAYVNDKLVYDTSKFYNNNGERAVYEVDDFDHVSISFNQPNDGIFYVDDLYMHRVKTK